MKSDVDPYSLFWIGLESLGTPDANKDKARNYLAAVGGVMVAQLGLSIWSCIDAVKIAKVKNQYYQDTKGKHAFSAIRFSAVSIICWRESSNSSLDIPIR